MNHLRIHLALLAAVACAAREPLSSPDSAGVVSAHPEKLDPALVAGMARGESQSVIILGTHQLIAPPAGLDSFARANDQADRLALRGEVVRRLREIARSEQSAILSALAIEPARPVRHLWIGNAMALTLTAAELAAASSLETVRFVFRTTEAITQGTAIGDAPTPTRVRSPGQRRVDAAIPWNVRLIGASRVWSELDITGRGVVVGILDGGVNVSHPDLRANAWTNDREQASNGRDDDSNGIVDDVHGVDFSRLRGEDTGAGSDAHATIVAGIVAGSGAGGIATGIAPDAHVMSLRGTSPSAAALAFQYALDQGVDILNMSFSLGGLGELRGFWRLIGTQAVAAGLVLVGGAGNAQQGAAVPVQITTPKDVPVVIVAGGIDSTNRLVSFSSIGPVEWASVSLYRDFPLPRGLVKPDIVAYPGPEYPLLQPVSGYIDPNTQFQGNSFSGPHAAGVAALILEADPMLPAWRVKELMESTARDVDAPGRDVRTGSGRLDAYAATLAARRAVPNAARP